MGNFLITPDEIKLVQEALGLSHFEVYLRPTWGSQSPGHREEIHGDVKQKMAKGYPFSDSSISHARSLGGYAFTKFDSDHVIQMGFDIEEDSRATDEIARRICLTPEEFERAPSPASLWSAKEACFKCLKGIHQPKVVSDLELIDWLSPRSHIETVRLKDPRKFGYSHVLGILLKKSPYTLAFFVSKP